MHVNPTQTSPGQTQRAVGSAARVLSIAALVGVAVMLTVAAWQDQGHSNALAARTDAITNSAHRVLVDLLNAETGQRGFLLTGQRVYLQPYWLGTGAVTGDLATLTRASRTVGPLAADLAALRTLTPDKLSELAAAIALARVGQHRQALALLDTNVGKDTMDLVRARVADIERVAGQLPVVAHQTAADAQTLALVLDAALVALALAGWWRIGSLRVGRERDRALGELAREALRLERALCEVSASASGEFDAHDLFGLVAGRVGEVLNADAAMVVRVEGVNGTPVGVHGLDALPVRESGVGSIALETGRPARFDDYASLRDGTRARTTAAGYRSAIAVPVRVHGRPWGYIAVANMNPHSFPGTAEAVLERFAGLVAIALAQADTLATLQRDATTDGLTGLVNHRAFQQVLHDEFARAERHQRPLSLVMFDVDDFKQVNDLHGHSAGDDVLQTVGRVLERDRRVNDIPARVGGDEFALIAPETLTADALSIAERLRTRIAAELRELGLSVTLSAGVTDLTAATTTHDLSSLADNALYHAKHHGRDQTVSYTPGLVGTAGQTADERRRALAALTALARAVDAKDSPTQRHSERVAVISTQLALRLAWTPRRCARLREAALLHDIGKIGVPDSILNKPAALTDDEYKRVKTHAQLGAQIVEGVLDSEQVSWVRGHHERPDGRGYPDALTAATIPDGARLLAIADTYDTVTSERPYRPARSPAQATREMSRHAGTQFDADLLDLLDRWAVDMTTPDASQTTLQPVTTVHDVTDPRATNATRGLTGDTAGPPIPAHAPASDSGGLA